MPKGTNKKPRKSPGSGGGKFYRIEVKDKNEFKAFRTQDVGKKGGLERIAGKRKDGTWDTATWLVSKDDAHVRGEKLIIDDKKAKSLLKQIKSPIKHVKNDVFKSLPKKAVKKKAKRKVK